MSNIFLEWAISKFPNDADLGRVFRMFYHEAKEGGNTDEACRTAEETIMTNFFNS